MDAPQKKHHQNLDVMPGDEVYFQHSTGPQSGKVKAVGKHGATIHHKEEAHKVKWQHVLGHKTRAKKQYAVEDEGEDGMLVKDEAGKRHYIAVPPDARTDQMVLSKSMNPTEGRIVVFIRKNKESA
jgi:co-chaperonin GroES (HSP10)